MFQACSQRLSDRSSIDVAERGRLLAQMASSEKRLLIDSFEGGDSDRSWACDVLIHVDDNPQSDFRLLVDSIRSAISQTSVYTIVHVFGGPLAGQAVEAINNPRQLIWHPNIPGQSVGRQMHRIIKELRTEFVAWQRAGSVASPTRIRDALNGLWLSGAEFSMTSGNGDGDESSLTIQEFSKRRVEDQREMIGSLVTRRSSLVDLQGFADCDDAAINLVKRALIARRLFRIGSESSEVDSAPLECLPISDSAESESERSSVPVPAINISISIRAK